MNDTRDVELNAIGVLKRREIEARILAPVVEALGREFGRERVLQIVGETIVGIARDQGRQLVQISAGAPDRARQPAGRRHHAGERGANLPPSAVFIPAVEQTPTSDSPKTSSVR
jgi:hypothetical protein